MDDCRRRAPTGLLMSLMFALPGMVLTLGHGSADDLCVGSPPGENETCITICYELWPVVLRHHQGLEWIAQQPG